MLQRDIAFDHVAPWVVSGASSLYILVRARRLSQADPCEDPLSRFLLGQSDMIFMLCSSPVIWYFTRRRRRAARKNGHGPQAMTERALHQLRQVFTAMLIGTGLLARKATASKTPGLAALAQRLHDIARDGASVLTDLDELCLDNATDTRWAITRPSLEHNGHSL